MTSIAHETPSEAGMKRAVKTRRKKTRNAANEPLHGERNAKT